VTLVDTSIWIEHFRRPNHRLGQLLVDGRVLAHPFVVDEIACGNLSNRKQILVLMQALPTVKPVDDQEILFLIERRSLMGRGIGLIDVHLLASCLTHPCPIWTSDKRLKTVAEELGAAVKWPS